MAVLTLDAGEWKDGATPNRQLSLRTVLERHENPGRVVRSKLVETLNHDSDRSVSWLGVGRKGHIRELLGDHIYYTGY